MPPGAGRHALVRVLVTRPKRTATLPLPPSVNHLYVRQGGRVRLSDAARDWREAARIATGIDLLPDGPVAVRVIVRGARHDLDNVLKALLDALNGAWWVDDSRVAWLLVRRSPGEPAVDVAAWAMPGAIPRPSRRRAPGGGGRSPWAALLLRRR